MTGAADQKTADAFARSWNNLPPGSVYSQAQFEDWLAPLRPADVTGRRVLELGCGGGSLLVHMADWHPAMLIGVDLGDSVAAAERNLAAVGVTTSHIVRHDLVTYRDASAFDVVYCIGVLHHLRDPRAGFASVLTNTAPGGRFHCWVYAHEGNGLVRTLVEPLRRVASRLPWWITKYALATPLVVPFFAYAKLLRWLGWPALRGLPLHDYSLWIAARDFAFFRHVAFDQLVTPHTVYLRRSTVEAWLRDPLIEMGSTYLVFRNGNSWKFGGRRRTAD